MGDGPIAPDRSDFSYSIVIPVYNSAGVVGATIDRVVEVFEAAGLRYQVVLVNDGSRDGSWEVIAERARRSPHVVALNLLRNYGQHHANLAGMRESTGDYVITMDDDLQNPPDQALLLIDEAMRGHDVVFGRFERKQAARLPTARQQADQRRQPPRLRAAARAGGLQLPDPAPRRGRPDLRVPHRAPLHHRPGADVLQQPADVLVRHDPRASRHQQLQHAPDHVAGAGDPVQLLGVPAAGRRGARVRRRRRSASCSALFYLVRSFFVESPVPGWTTIAVLLAHAQRRGDHAALDARRVRRPHPQRGQRGDHATT